MSDEGWPADPTDPRCPTCGEPVSATASYCLHCEADLPTADGPPTDSTTSDAVESTTTVDTTTAAGATTTADADAATPDDSSGPTGATGLLDDAATFVVALAAGLVSGLAILATTALLIPGGGPFVVAVVVWLAVTNYAGRTPTVVGAVRRGGYAVAASLALVPVAAGLAGSVEPATLEGRLFTVVFLGAFVWPVAAVVAGVGFAVGRLFGDD